MPPTLILIRHAEAWHNRTDMLTLIFAYDVLLTGFVQNYDLPDPKLTDGGVQQCEDLQRHLKSSSPLASRVERIITSPMRRTLQTTLISLQWLINSGVPVDVDPMWQENSTAACDTGTDLKIIASEFPDLDFSSVDPIYPSKSGDTPYAFTRTANQGRGEACLKALYDRPEKVIAVVSHAGFLRTGITRRRFENADYRIFTFARDSEGRLELFEDAATEKKGGGMGRSAKGIYLLNDWDFPPENIAEEEVEDEDDT